MAGRIAALYRHPIKGFTPHKVAGAFLEFGRAFPGDRLWAVEDGPSGFDPERPAHISKSRFTVLAKIPEVALTRTDYDVETGVLTAAAPRLPTRRLHEFYGHLLCGIYVQVGAPGRVAEGDEAKLLP